MLPGAAARSFEVDAVGHTFDRLHAQTTPGQLTDQTPHKLRFFRTLANQAEGLRRAIPFRHQQGC